MKICTNCKISKLEAEFSPRKPRGLSSWCKDCKNKSIEEYRKNDAGYHKRKSAKQRERRVSTRQKIWNFLKDHPCVDCGETNPIVLDFDHQRDKLFNIGDAVRRGFGWHAISEEIKKCLVRCANCHRIKTAKERGFYKYVNF